MADMLKQILDRLQGRNTEDEEDVKKKADEAQKKYEASIGTSVPEEAGIEEGSVEDFVPGMEKELAAQGWKTAGAPPPTGGRLSKLAMPEAAAEAASTEGAATKLFSPSTVAKSEPGVIQYNPGKWAQRDQNVFQAEQAKRKAQEEARKR